MIRLIELLRLAFAWLNAPVAAANLEPDLTPRDWADLPPHHPKAECTPC